MQDDPLFVRYYLDPITRNIKNVISCKNMILVGILSGEAYITLSDNEGVAV